jgi:predicted nucleotidyltransferase component of viral defense system
MKNYNQPRVKQAEIAQLILLESLFSLRESKEVCFQGGTAIRWFYGGMRFSEDLDFVTTLSRQRVGAMVKSVQEPIRRLMIANFGAGTFTLQEKKSHPSSYKAFIHFQPAVERGKISELILAVQNAFRKVEAKGIIDFSLYRTRKQAIL